MILPTLVIVGAQKSGTTTLRGLLAQHEQIFMSSPKELHFFDTHYDRGLDWYRSCFNPTANQVHAGEATPVYMYKTVARDRMTRDLPDARFLCILRNPVDRAYSHYWHAREKGPEKSTTFEQALKREPRRLARDPHGQPAAFSYVDRGKYIDQIRPLVDAVGSDRLHVLLMDDLLDDPAGTMEPVLRFLGVDVAAAAELVVGAANAYGGGEANRQGEARLRSPRDRRDLPVGEYPPMAPETRAQLTTVFAPYNRQLSEYLGRPLTIWDS
jgi:Sulfotransferase domain